MTSACRPLTAWRHLAALLCAATIFVPGPAEAQPCGTCARTSLGLAPRSYAAGDAPVAAAAGDLNGDGRADLVVANNPPGAGKVRVLLGGPNGFVVLGAYDQTPVPRGVAIADFDTDGLLDVVVAAGDVSSGLVQVLRNTGSGNLSPLISRSAGLNTSAVVVGDFDGNGTPDVAAASEGSNQVFVFLGDGKGGLDSGHITTVGNQPRALVAGFFDAGGVLDLAVACAADDQVRVLKGNGNGTFTTGPVVDVNPAVGTDEPVSIAAADLELDGDLDIVTANRSSATVSVFKNDGTGGFALEVTPLGGGNPNGVAVLPVDNSSRPDIATSNPGSQSVDLLLDDGAGGFQAATRHYVLMSPQAVVAVDADADGRLDLAVPCRGSDAVTVLISRPPGPPAFGAAVRYPVGPQPAAAVAVDLDGVNGLDLAVANNLDSTVSILLNNGSGSFTSFGVPRPVRTRPRAIVAGDFDGDGIQDLAITSNVTDEVSLLRGTGGGNFASVAWISAGSGPDGLVAADVDGDLDLDLLVCNNGDGTVSFLRNDSVSGTISFVLADTFAVGPDPTAIFAGRLDNNSTVDFAVANSTATRLTVLHGDGTGSFDDLAPEILNLTGGDANPTSVTGADFDGDGDIDLAATVLNGSAVSVFQNGGTSFAQPPARIPATDLAVHATTADLNLDGKIDLAIAAPGLEVLRGRGSVASFEEGEGFVAGLTPLHVVVADLSGDGRPDIAVVNRDSNDVSILLGTGCTARRLEVTQQPAQSCVTGPAPYPGLQAIVEARDDGGNLACPVGDVTATIVPGSGTAGALLTGTGNDPPRVSLSDGVAFFTTGASKSLTIDKAGRRYRLQFSLPSLPGVPPVVSQSFTLGAQPVILGPTSFCPGAQATYAADPAEGSYDEYRWTLDGAPSPFAFTPSILLKEPPTLSLGSHTLALDARVDSCALSASPRTIWYRTWLSTSLSTLGPTTVCVDCLGGTVKPTDLGGGAVVSRQWGYRAVSAGTITPIGGETAETYVVKGTDFPGPGTYYLVVTTVFTCPSTSSVSFELPIVVSAEVQTSEVQYLAVTSRGAGATGENLLQWVNSIGSPDEICIRWNKAPDGTSACTFPVVPDCPSADGPNWHRMLNPPADTRGWSHAGVSVDTAYCYAVFVRDDDNVPPWSPGRVVKARAFDADAGPVKWAYSTGATAVVPPVIGKYGILAMSNDRTVHEITRGSAGGIWPGPWTPQALSGVVHSRSPIVPFGSGLVAVGDKSVLFVADDTGVAQAVDALTGQALWGTLGSDPSAGTATITGAPGAILQQYTGVRDLILVGTRHKTPLTNASALFGLNPSDGNAIATFDGGGTLGPVVGSPAVDYATQRVYFTSRRHLSGDTVWAVNVNASAPVFTTAWSDYLGEFDTSPVLRGGRLYVANTTNVVYSLDATSGSDTRTMNTFDGPVKGFLFPDRRNDDVFFATNTKVWSVSDTAGGFVTNWSWTRPAGSPSIVLFWPQTNYVYVGGGNGKLWQLDFTYPTAHPSFAKSLTLGDGTGQIGAPTLDIGVNPKLLVVGSESGVLYGVEVPF